MTISEIIQTILGITVVETEKIALVDLIIEQSQAKICAYINASIVPAELNFIIIELTIERYNKIGSEGLLSESIEGIQYSYSDTFELERYTTYLDRYVSKSSGFKFL
jgi:hypothetical protein